MKILVLNCGGSSVKYGVYEFPREACLVQGNVAKLGGGAADCSFELNDIKEQISVPGLETHVEAIDWILSRLKELQEEITIDAVSHRVVHGGDRYTGTVLIDHDVIHTLYQCSELAPLHNPHNIRGIEACQEILPHVPQVAVFDNAFHRDLPLVAQLYGLPYEFYERDRIRRYGFHGLAFQYMTEAAAKLVNKSLHELKVISLMLGSGTTVSALKNGKVQDVSTGFTPCEGLLQSTRSGDVDPALLMHIMKKKQLTPEQMEEILYKKSGWLGLSGISADMKDLEQAALSGDSRARLALDVLVYRCRKYIGAYAAAMNGLDMLIFSGGVGEKSSFLREEICKDLTLFGIELSEDKNLAAGGERVISSSHSQVSVVVVMAQEELVLAREAAGLLAHKEL